MSETAVQVPEAPITNWPGELPTQTALQESVHDRHWNARAKIIFALNDSYMRWHQKTATRLSYCANGASFFVDPATTKVRPWISRCHCRMCPYCARSRSGRVSDQLLAILNKMATPRMVILTVKSNNRPLADQLRSLRQDFAKLRRRKFWKAMVTGGAYTVEITRNETSGLWHPHLHLIVDGKYIPQKLLRNRWHDVTGSAEIVWVEAVDDRQGAARELAKYIGKPQRIKDMPPTAIREYAHAVNGTRMVQAFGNVHGLKAEDRDPDDPDSPDVYTVRISRLVHLAFRGADTAQRLLLLIADRWPQFRSYIYHQIPKLEPPKSRAAKMKRLLRITSDRAPPPGPSVTATIDHEKQDREIFMAFTAYRCDEQADVFTDLDFVFGELQQWT